MIKYQIQWTDKDASPTYQYWFPFETYATKNAGMEGMKYTTDYFPDRSFRLVEITERVIG